jgi:outer membrane protein TolC
VSRTAGALRAAGALIGLVLAPVLSGCGSSLIAESGGGPAALPEWRPYRYAPPAPGVPWRLRPAASDPLPGERPLGVPPALDPAAFALTLPQLLGVALDNTPATRQAWEQARAAAAAWGQARGDYYPASTLTASGLVSRGGAVARTGTGAFLSAGGSPTRATAALADLSVSYLLLDFGGRRGRVDSAEQALRSANWNHSQVVQDVARNVARAYHAYVGSKAQVLASRATLEEARTSLEAVDTRRRAGVATVAEVYQAESTVAQARLALERDEGNQQISRGTLATAVGWPANTVFDVAPGDPVPIEAVSRSVEDLIDEAQRQRPDLAAVRAFVRQKEADLRQAESARWPALFGVASVGTLGVDGTVAAGNDPNYLAGIQLQIPVFQGGALDNAVRAAQADLGAARAALQLQGETVIAEVWNAYANVRVATQQVSSSEALLRSAELAYEAALARYRAGATNVVELVTVQSTLAGARSQQVQARTDLFTSYAELVRAIGVLPGTAAAPVPAPPPERPGGAPPR